MTVSGLATPFGFQDFPNYTEGRSAAVNKIVIHHMATTNYDSVPGIWKNREASAYYGVGQDGQIRAYVDEDNTAWHAGQWAANSSSIGIEHANTTGAPDWGIAQATVDSSAKLVADIAKRYGFGKVVPYQNLFPHSEFIATGCPGHLKEKLQEIADKANAINNGGSYVAPQDAPASDGGSDDKPETSIEKFKDGKDRFVLSDWFTIQDVQQINGIWQVRVDELCADPFDWTDNGIPCVIIENQNGNQNFETGDKARFKSAYNHGTIDEYSETYNAVGIDYIAGYGRIWYGADKFYNHA